MFADGPHVHEYLAEMTRAVFADRDGDFITVGEMPAVTTDQARLYTDPARRELNMVFQFEHMSVDQGPAGKYDYRRSRPRRAEEVAASLAARVGGRPVGTACTGTTTTSLAWCPGSATTIPMYWAASAKALATVLHGMRGTPFVYQGEELGMTNYPFRDPAGLQGSRGRELLRQRGRAAAATTAAAMAGLAKISRDNARTPMQWDAGPHGGFTTGDPWLPVNPNHTWLNAEAQVAGNRIPSSRTTGRSSAFATSCRSSGTACSRR